MRNTKLEKLRESWEKSVHMATINHGKKRWMRKKYNRKETETEQKLEDMNERVILIYVNIIKCSAL